MLRVRFSSPAQNFPFKMTEIKTTYRFPEPTEAQALELELDKLSSRITSYLTGIRSELAAASSENHDTLQAKLILDTKNIHEKSNRINRLLYEEKVRLAESFKRSGEEHYFYELGFSTGVDWPALYVPGGPYISAEPNYEKFHEVPSSKRDFYKQSRLNNQEYLRGFKDGYKKNPRSKLHPLGLT